jgi:hypothetical protein
MLGKKVAVSFKSFSAPTLASLLFEKLIFFVSAFGND